MISTEQTVTSFSFLTSGPTYSVTLPAQVPSVPDLGSPIISGAGPRTFAFTPYPRAEELADGMMTEGTLIKAMTTRDGRELLLYQRPEQPVVWWLIWSLRGGVLTSHLRAIDGIEAADVVAANVEVNEELSTPYLLLFDPIRRGVSSLPGYQETATLESLDGDLFLALFRPAYVAAGRMMSSMVNGRYQFRAGTMEGVEIQVSSSVRQKAQDVISLLLASFG